MTSNSTIDVPSNVPADIVEAAKSFLRHASEADGDGGGIKSYAAFVVGGDQGLHMVGHMPEEMAQGVVMAISMAILHEVASEGRCNCPECAAGRADQKPLDVAAELARIASAAPKPTGEGIVEPVKPVSSGLFKRLFGRGRK